MFSQDYCLTEYGKAIAEEWMNYAVKVGRDYAAHKRLDSDQAASNAMIALIECIAQYNPARCGAIKPYLQIHLKWALCKTFHVNPNRLRFHRNHRSRPCGFDFPVKHEGYDQIFVESELDKLMRCLNRDERSLMEGYFGLGISQQETGRKTGVTGQCINKRLKRLMASVREHNGITVPQ